jgi:hypothetical protein
MTPREKLRKSLEENRKRVAEWTPQMHQAIDTLRVFHVPPPKERKMTPYEKAIAICRAAAPADSQDYAVFARTLTPEVVAEMLEWMHDVWNEDGYPSIAMWERYDKIIHKIGGE